MQLSISPLWAVVIMDHFHREPTESKPEVTEKWPQANRPSTPVSAYTHSSAVTRRLYLQPPAWSSSPSSSPLPKFWTCQNVWGNKVNRNPKPEHQGRGGTLAVSTSRKSENTGRGVGGGMLLHELFCLFRFRRLTWPPLPSARLWLRATEEAGGRWGWAPAKASTQRQVRIATA